MRGEGPTRKQMQYLRWLAWKTGTTFEYPRSSREASRTISAMQRRLDAAPGDITREQRAVSRDMSTLRGDDAQVRPEELEGYGSSATWARTSGGQAS